MNIFFNQSNVNKNVKFSAKKVAGTKNQIRNIVTNIDVYKLEHRVDDSFLRQLRDSVDFKSLSTKVEPSKLQRVQMIFNYCIQEAFQPEKETMVAVCKNKICGILTYFIDESYMHLDAICSIPIKIDEKVNLVGKTLFQQLFKDAKENNVKTIELEAVLDSTQDLVRKYKGLGFKDLGFEDGYEKMECGKFNIDKQIEELGKRIQNEKVVDDINYDLKQFI